MVEPGDIIIVVKRDGQVCYWQQDTPEVRTYLDAVEELSTCMCEADVCPAYEMDDWRQQLANGVIVDEHGQTVMQLDL